ncbi:MAG: hypothetical protein ROO76_10080 [Terriglobia bacterium]|nr:hypothetical protein [Terriglobia bacterium]
MTIREAAEHWEDSRRSLLQTWADSFGVRLNELHIGHVRTYKEERGQHVPGAQIDAEVDALFALLQEIGLGSEVRPFYQSFAQAEELTPAELNALSDPVRRHIARLKREISQLHAEGENMKIRVRKATWGRDR